MTLQDYSEEAPSIEPARIGPHGFRLADETVPHRILGEKCPKPPVGIDVVDYHGAARNKMFPRSAKFEQDIALRVKAVVNEHADFA